MEKILEFQSISFYYQEGDNRVDILNNINLTFNKGTFYAIVGPSGSGKTTTLALASALETPKEGRIMYNSSDIGKLGLTKYRKKCVSIVFQNYNLINYMTAMENVIMAMEIAEANVTNKQKRALDLLKMVGITEVEANRNVLRLSGGQQQRVGIARALASDAKVILADEPTGNLDATTSEDIIAIFKRLAKEFDKCVIVVTHSNEVAKQADIVYRLEKGTLVSSASSNSRIVV